MQIPIRILICSVLFLPATKTLADPDQEIRLIKRVFQAIQALSLEQDREYCGYIGLNDEGVLIASRPKRGRKSSCTPSDPDDIEIIIASYHTHGGYDGSDAYEVPSVDDIESDEAEGIDGYVATPSGRLWFIDTEDMMISQICGIGCLEQAEGYVPEPGSDIRLSYSYDELVIWYDGD